MLGHIETAPLPNNLRQPGGYARVRSGRSLWGVALLVVLLWATVMAIAPLEFAALYSFSCLASLTCLMVIPQFRELSIRDAQVELRETALTYERVTRVLRADLRCVVFRHSGRRGVRVWIEASDRTLVVLHGANEDASTAETLARALARQLCIVGVRERAWGGREPLGVPERT